MIHEILEILCNKYFYQNQINGRNLRSNEFSENKIKNTFAIDYSRGINS